MPEEIGHVNAHGSSMIQPDRHEARAIRNCLGECPVTAPKSYFGCLGAGSGAVEMVASLMALNEGLIPPTLNYETRDPECPVHVVCDSAEPQGNRAALVFNQSETGQVAAAVLGPA
jgi:3-oxoacyl-[acyl-carrier-protein] synthase II